MINWGNTNFDGPYSIANWDPPFRAALYTIMYKRDPNQELYTLIYIGESGNLSERGFIRSHHKYNCFIGAAGSESNLYIGIYLMPNSTSQERRERESFILNQLTFTPDCQD